MSGHDSAFRRDHEADMADPEYREAFEGTEFILAIWQRMVGRKHRRWWRRG